MFLHEKYFGDFRAMADLGYDVPCGPTEYLAPLLGVAGVSIYRDMPGAEQFVAETRAAAEEFCRINSGKGISRTQYVGERLQDWEVYRRYPSGFLVRRRIGACDEGGRW